MLCQALSSAAVDVLGLQQCLAVSGTCHSDTDTSYSIGHFAAEKYIVVTCCYLFISGFIRTYKYYKCNKVVMKI